MENFYQRFYAVVPSSQANATFCERLYGQNMCQHGFAEVGHLNHLILTAGLGPGMRVLDLGCGNGYIAEYISDRCGALVTGIDFISEAIRQAQERTQAKQDRLQFQVMDIGRLDFPAASFDAVAAIDSLYFTPLAETLKSIVTVLKPGGRLGVFWSQSCEPWIPLEEFDRSKVLPDCTELAIELQKLGLPYRTWDYSQDDYDHANRKLRIAESLQSAFEAEGNGFLYENHVGEAKGVLRAFEAGAHGRYLYVAQKK